MKYQTTADVNLFIKPVEAADATKLIKAGTEFETDGITISANCKSTQSGSMTFLKAKIGNDVGYILAVWAEPVPVHQQAPVYQRPGPLAPGA
jgi:hypothetical protein